MNGKFYRNAFLLITGTVFVLISQFTKANAQESPTPAIADEHLAATVVDNTKASSLDLSTVNITSATLTTDKGDYAPTDSAVISGTGFIPHKEYTLEITSTDPPPVDFFTQIVMDANGNFVYAYQLDGNYRPNYKVYIKDGSVIVATISFTDAKGLVLTFAGTGSGSIAVVDTTDSSKNTTCTATCTVSVGNNDTGTITASANAGSSLGGWSLQSAGITGCTSTACTFSMGNNAQNATFTFNGSSATPTPTPTPGSGNPSISLEQCHNNDGSGNFVDCKDPSSPTNTWGGGNANSSSAKLFEGNSQNYRVVLTNMPIGVPQTIFIGQQYTKGGKMAYDFPTGPGNLGTATSPIGLAGVFPCDDNSGGLLVTPCDHNVPSNSLMTGHKLEINAIPSTGIIPDPTVETQTINAQSIYYGLSENTSPTRSPQYMYVYGATPGSFGTYSFVGTASDIATGDTELDWSFSFTPTASTVVVTWGAHISKFGDYGTKGTALTISGSPYHTFLNETTFTSGKKSQDMQMAGNAVIQPSTITIHKVTDPNSDTTTSFAFTTTGTGYNGFNLTGGTSNQQNVAPGTYSVTETDPGPTYANSALVCNTVSGQGTSATPTLGSRSVAITIGSGGGGVVDCTYTNTLQTGTLKVIKHVINDNGGTKTASDFSLHVKSGVNDVTGSPQNGSETGTTYTLNQGTYNVSEGTLPTGYTNVTTNTNNGDCDASGNVSVVAGQNKTCTITNDDQAAHLIVIKHVINDNGGSKSASDFSTTITGVTTANPTAAGAESPGVDNTLTSVGSYSIDEGAHVGYAKSLSADCSGTIALGETKTCTITNNDIQPKLTLTKVVINNNGGTAVVADFPLFVDATEVTSGVQNGFDAGSYTASETNLTGYAAGSWTGDCAADGSITLAAGDVKSCTITNDDIAPKLTLVKTVVNDNGGTKVVSDFPLFINGNGVTSGTSNTLLANTLYTATETPDAAYTASDWGGDCAKDGTITLSPGDDKTCTITNDDIAPKLHLRKIIVNNNGGTATAADFPLLADGTGTNDISGTSPVDSDSTLKADTFALSETNAAGYSASDWSCVGGSLNDSNITLGAGDEATCTITNDDVAPQLHLRKEINNDNGGTATVADFTLTANGTGSNDISGTSPVDSGAGLLADTFALSETGVTGYSSSSWDCVGGTLNGSNITLGLGQSSTCTITNDDIAPKLTLVKTVINNNGGTKVVSDFPLFINGNSVTSGDANTLTAGTLYTATETSDPGYAASSWGGDCTAGGTITLAPGDDKTCTITNDDISPKLTIVKDAQPNDLQDFAFGGTLGAFSLDDDSGVSGEDNTLSNTKLFDNITAGSKTINETEPNQYWKNGGITCVNNANQSSFPATVNGTSLTLNLPLASDVTCTFVNIKTSPTRTLGFWQTHTDFTTSIFNSKLLFVGVNTPVVSGTHKGILTTQGQLFGAFYAPIAKTTTGVKRSPGDQARIQLLQQLVAAKLNCAAFTCQPSVQTLIANADAAYAGGDKNTIQPFITQLDAFNNSGDTIIIVGNPGNATPKTSQSIANLSFWDLP